MHSTKALLYSSIFIAEVYTALAAPNLTYRTIPNSDYSSVTETMGPKKSALASDIDKRFNKGQGICV